MVVAVSTCTFATATMSSAAPPPFSDAFLHHARSLEPEFGASHRTLVRVFGAEVVEAVELGAAQGGLFGLSEEEMQRIQSSSTSASAGIVEPLLESIDVRVGFSRHAHTDEEGTIRRSLVSSFQYGIVHDASGTVGAVFGYGNHVRPCCLLPSVLDHQPLGRDGNSGCIWPFRSSNGRLCVVAAAVVAADTPVAQHISRLRSMHSVTSCGSRGWGVFPSHAMKMQSRLADTVPAWPWLKCLWRASVLTSVALGCRRRWTLRRFG